MQFSNWHMKFKTKQILSVHVFKRHPCHFSCSDYFIHVLLKAFSNLASLAQPES